MAGCSGQSSKTDAGPDAGPDGQDKWEPPHVYRDVAYTQEIGQILDESFEARAVALDADDVPHLATDQGVKKYTGDEWVAVDSPLTGAVHDLTFGASGVLAVVGPQGVAVGDSTPTLPDGAEPSFITPRSSGGFWVGGDSFAGNLDPGFTSLYEDIGEAVHDMCDVGGDWYAATSSGVYSAEGVATTADGLPSDEVRALAVAPDGTLWAGTDSGLARRDAGSGNWIAFGGEDGLHYGDVLDLGFDAQGKMLIATSMGASLFTPEGSGRYYLGRDWLPANHVNGIARAADGTLWAATSGGASMVEQHQMTLAEKAALFDAITQERHVRLGYTSTENHLAEFGDLESSYNTDNDNDGQWTGMYLASQCFRFAVTGEAEARENARTAAYAMMKLEEVTPLEGFFARSIVPGDECEAKQEGPGEWHLAEDEQWCWKGDTSSDEFVGHMFGLSIFYDLVADEQERADVAGTVSRIVGYIMDKGYQLLDIDGEPTTHGFFNPEWMEENPGAIFGDAGLNSAMILGGLLAAYHMTGEERFREGFDYLIEEHGYADYVACIEETNTAWHINHDSEEMSFLAMYTLLRYTDDPELLDRWTNGDPGLECAGLQYLWEYQRPERNPEFNMIYAPLARKDEYDLDISIETLKKLSTNLILWGLDNGRRLDRDENPYDDRHGQAQNMFVFPYDERQVMRWAENPYKYVQRGSGFSESSGTFWLLPYWMGRYHGLIE